MQRDDRADVLLVTIRQFVIRAAVAGPVYRLRILLIAQCVNVYLIGYHEGTVEAETEMSDNLIRIRLILILRNKICRTRERDLVDILINLLRCHTDTIIAELDRPLIRIHDDINPTLIIIRLRPLANQ